MDSLGSNLPMQSISIAVLKEKYAKGTEKDEDSIFKRVAKGLASVEKESLRKEFEEKFLTNMRKGAIGAGRIMSAAGSGIQATLINCFVQPVGDSIQGIDQEGMPGIYVALKEAAETMRRGGGVGYDFSPIRPKGAEVNSTASLASGPCSYINVFDQSCSTVESAGARRGAQMGILRIDHPDIFEFINAKRTLGRWNNFNISVGVTDAFMNSVLNNETWELTHRARPGAALLQLGARQRPDGLWIYQSVPAQVIWEKIMQSAYDFAEPGIIFLDHINRENNLSYCESITATNPCGEQPLPAYGCCDLGPVILPKFVKNAFGFEGEPTFDFTSFAEVITIQVRMLDNVLEATYWPLPEQAVEAKQKRRIGVGFTGLGDALIMLKLPYNTIEARRMAQSIAKVMRDAAYSASVELAKEKGRFPLFDPHQYFNGQNFASRLDPKLKEQIKKHGIRNSHLLSIAPTGTVSLAFADNASNGIEPAFSWIYHRKKREPDGTTTAYTVEDHAWRIYRQLGGDVEHLPVYFVTALEMAATDHIAMMEAVQPYIDTAISKTVNVPVDYPYALFKDLYLQGWKAHLKGLTTYRPNAILGAVLEPIDTDPKEQSFAQTNHDPMRSVIHSRPKGGLPAIAEKIEYWTQEGHKTLYLIVSFISIINPNKEGIKERAIEFFMPVGQNCESQQWITSSMRLLSLAARGGFLERALSDMRKVAWDRGHVRLGSYEKEDGTQIPLWHDSEVSAIAYAIQNIIDRRNGKPYDDFSANPASAKAAHPVMVGKKCNECHMNAVIKKDGCEFCTQCGHIGSCG